MSWPINHCPLSTQQCAILFLDQKKEKIKNTGKCSKIKPNTTSKESIKLCFSLILWVFFFCNKSPKGQADMVSPQQSFSLFPLLNASQKLCWSPAGITVGRGRLCKTNMMSKIFDPLALPKGQGYRSLQMTSWVRDQTKHAKSAIRAKSLVFISAP